MKFKKIYAAALAATMCCASAYPTVAADANPTIMNTPTAVAAVSTGGSTVIAANNIEKTNLDSVCGNAVKTASTDTDDPETIDIIVTPTLDDEQTTTLTIKVFDDTNDPDHTKNQTVGAGYGIKIAKIDGDSVEIVDDKNIIRTDANGCVKVEKIPVGQYQVYFDGDNGSSVKYFDVSTELTLTVDAAMTLSVYTKQVSDRAMLKFAFCKYDGTAPDISTKYAIENVPVSIKNTETGSQYTAKSDKNGIVSFKDIDPGSYTFAVGTMPSGYTAAVSTGTVNGITVDGSKTMNIPTHVKELGEVTVKITIDPWVAITNEGEADQTQIEYGLCTYNGMSISEDGSVDYDYDCIKTYTYDEVVNGIEYTIAADNRSKNWYFAIINTERCGYVLNESLSEIRTSSEDLIVYNDLMPHVLTKNVTVRTEPDTPIHIYPQDPAYISEHNISSDQIKQADADGIIVFDDVPFGNYYIEDMTTKSLKNVSVVSQYSPLFVEMPSKEESNIHYCELRDMYDNIVEKQNCLLDDITKPESQGDKSAIYKVTCETGNPYSSTGTAISRTIIRINADGTIVNIGGSVIGDANGDEKFDRYDLIALQQFLLAADTDGCPNWKLIDLDCDDTLTVFDLCMARQLYVKVHESFNVDINDQSQTPLQN